MRQRDVNEQRRVMSLAGHMRELTRRGIYIVAGILGGSIAGWMLSDLVWELFRAPVAIFAGQDHRYAAANYTTVTGAFELKMQIAIVTGVIISSPFWLYHVFAFFVPALKRSERRYVFGFVFSAVPLFLGGCAAGWMVMPHVIELMLGFAAHGTSTLLSAKDFLDFALKLIVVTGMAFVLPDFLVLLNFAGVISGRTILKSWRIAILLITAFTAIATPAADVLSMFALAVPMVVLYFAAVIVATVHDRRVERRLLDAPARSAVEGKL